MKLIRSLAVLTVLAASACSSAPPVKEQAYAKLGDTRTFEYDFPTTWRAIEAALSNFKVTSRDPEDVTPLDLKKLTRRKLDTDWLYGQSRDKYIEFKVNDLPRKQYLQTRVRYTVIASSVLGGTEVHVKTNEEIERLKPDGTSAGYEAEKDIDTSRPAEILDRISQALLSAAP